MGAWHRVRGEVWQRSVGCVERESSGRVDGDVNLDALVEVRRESGSVCKLMYTRARRGNLLKLSEPCSRKLLAFLRDVNPETAFSADGTGALDGEPDEIGSVARWRQVDVVVAARDVWGTSIGQGEQVDRLNGLEV